MAYKKTCVNRSKKNKARYNNRKMKQRKQLLILRGKKLKDLTNLSQNPNKIFKLMQFKKKDGKDIGGGRCVKGKDEKLGFGEKNMEESHGNYE